ncbi:MAG: transcriptional regulator, DeoR family [Lachnospiraceae bacterium]|jgi:DeoR/GlpR family transcriptional regulator of sugar metabolism|nr:transcriptional regulator, DeoR family [Lachnospiraceae bacterium]
MSSKIDKRRLDITRIMQIEGKANVADMAKMLGVTMETIRADFDYLAKQHSWVRTHGGMQMKEFSKYHKNYFFHDRQTVHMKEKKKLCLKAMELISDGDCIYVDSGSTVIYLLNYINQRSNLTIVTNSIGFLIRYTTDGFEKIFKEQGHRLVFLGGEVETNMMMTYGVFFEQAITEFVYDHVIFSVDALDAEIGGTNVDYQAYAAIKSVFQYVKNKILLLDNSKFDLRATYKIIGLDEIDYLITNQPLKEPWESMSKHKSNRIIAV